MSKFDLPPIQPQQPTQPSSKIEKHPKGEKTISLMGHKYATKTLAGSDTTKKKVVTQSKAMESPKEQPITSKGKPPSISFKKNISPKVAEKMQKISKILKSSIKRGKQKLSSFRSSWKTKSQQTLKSSVKTSTEKRMTTQKKRALQDARRRQRLLKLRRQTRAAQAAEKGKAVARSERQLSRQKREVETRDMERCLKKSEQVKEKKERYVKNSGRREDIKETERKE